MSNEAKHTPEPWSISWEKRGNFGDKESMQRFHTIEACMQPKGVNGRSLVVAEMRVGDNSFGFDPGAINHCVADSEARANAQRIVACVNACKGINPEAVPELLEALKELEAVALMGYRPDKQELARVRAAIAKAEGKE